MKKVNFKVLITDYARNYSSMFPFNEISIPDSYYTNSKNFFCLQLAYVSILYITEDITYIDHNVEKFHFFMITDALGGTVKPERSMDIYGSDINISYLNIFTKEGYLNNVYKFEILDMEEIKEEE